MGEGIGEKRPESPPESLDEVCEQMKTAWATPLPERLKNSFHPDEEISREDLFAREQERLVTSQVEDQTPEYQHIRNQVEQASGNETGDELPTTNNLYIWFMPKNTQKISHGIFPSQSPWNLHPFFLNEKFDGSWSEMCEKFPTEVKQAIAFAHFEQHPAVQTDATKQAFFKMAKYLHTEKQIPWRFLTR